MLNLLIPQVFTLTLEIEVSKLNRDVGSVVEFSN